MTKPELKLTFLGGAHEIGASATLLEVGATRLLVDCGVRFNADNRLPDLAPLQGKHLDGIAVTHAHSDHTGGLPVICDAFPDTPIFASPPTQDITLLLLGDALKLMGLAEREAEVPLYAEKQVTRVVEAFRPVHHGETVAVGEIVLTFLPAGHILGASMIHAATPAGNVLFTGDYSVSAQHTVPALSRPLLHTDMVITEATYGDRLHEDRDAAETRLIARIREVLEAEGRVLIPAFAVGRAQEILLILKRALRNRTLPEVPVFVDGMVRAVCGVYARHEKYVSRALSHEIRKAGHPFYTNGIQAVETPRDRAEALEKGPAVIVASSGMLSGGASVAYAAEMLGKQNDAILITGYQDEESPGRALLDLADGSEAREIRLAGRTVPVQCGFEKYGLSAHADRMQMVGLVESLRPRTVVLVHGDAAARNALAEGFSAGDVILASNGREVVRSYPLRKSAVSEVKTRRQLDLASARRILGPAGGPPVRAMSVAEAWYGSAVTAETADRFVRELEALDLVRRDDRLRNMLHILVPSETDAFPAEAALEAALKQENPKGKLLEFCMRERITPPTFAINQDGPFFIAEGTLCVHGDTLESGPARAASKRTAEQLAARSILRRISNRTAASGAVTWVDDASAAALKNRNPKGRLIEWCNAAQTAAPVFDITAVVDGFHAEAAVTLPSGELLRSRRMGARVKKNAEQAAADALLSVLIALPETKPASTQASGSRRPATEAPASNSESASAAPGEAHGKRDAMMLLNEMRQLSLLRDFDYTVQSTTGPSHQPYFEIVGRAVLEDGDTVETEPVVAAAKKAGRRLAAEKLVEKLREIGMLSG